MFVDALHQQVSWILRCSIDDTGNIKFTCEEESEKTLPFLDAKIIRNDDGSIRLQIYRKKTHTDQYLMFDSHHPLQHKLSVVRTLLSRSDEIVTNEEDRKTEEAHVKTVLKACKYPDWAIEHFRKQLNDKKQGITQPKPSTDKPETKKRGQVTLPYIQGVTERMHRVMKKHGF